MVTHPPISNAYPFAKKKKKKCEHYQHMGKYWSVPNNHSYRRYAM